jgi:hypothetical protein
MKYESTSTSADDEGGRRLVRTPAVSAFPAKPKPSASMGYSPVLPGLFSPAMIARHYLQRNSLPPS